MVTVEGALFWITRKRKSLQYFSVVHSIFSRVELSPGYQIKANQTLTATANESKKMIDKG
jgi:hypothetical protein